MADGAFSFSGSGQMGLVFAAKAGPSMTVAYGKLLVAEPYGFPPARERRENEKAPGWPTKACGESRPIAKSHSQSLISRKADVIPAAKSSSPRRRESRVIR